MVGNSDHVVKTLFLDTHGEQLYTSILEKDLEGMAAKRKHSKYVSRRSHDWLKVINWKETEVYLTGYKKKDFGWLCAVKRGDRMVPVGVLEYGGSTEQRKAWLSTKPPLT
ncbi:hypothetical protein [Fictibacillus enclensis]|uniref:hypothetical protein n=1 Tax=Fictibacillus enclensis TaxID=1017270 RepID=UPI0025A2679E|nr:hypothetical protein [Fictibacillus enclensis]